MCCLAYGFLFMIIFVFVIGGIHPLPGEYLIFQSIDECEALIPEDQSGVKIERYATPDADKDLKGLPYERFFGMQFESDEMEYQIFAYEFENIESALKYFENATGKKYSLEEDQAFLEQRDYQIFSASSGMTSSRIVVLSENRAYQLRAPKRYIDEIHAVLKDTFSQQVAKLR